MYNFITYVMYNVTVSIFRCEKIQCVCLCFCCYSRRPAGLVEEHWVLLWEVAGHHSGYGASELTDRDKYTLQKFRVPEKSLCA